jgi:ElaB/YqjD/DUF883 family membrane-anchored ribosome-binding protein
MQDDPATAIGQPATPAATDTGRPSNFAPPAAPTAVASTDVGAGAPFATDNKRTTDMNRPEKLDEMFDQGTKDKAAADATKLGDDAKKIKDDAAVVGEDLAKLAREAVAALQRVADDLGTKAASKAGDAVETAKGVGLATVDNVTAVASDAKHRVDNGVETLSQSVSRNPLTAVAIAAGVGMLFGMMNRSDRR